MGFQRFVAAIMTALLCGGAWSSPVRAWGDEGHEIVGLIAQSLLDPIVRQKVSALLAADTDTLTAHDIADETTWADRYREADLDGSKDRTKRWHFVDIELRNPDIDWGATAIRIYRRALWRPTGRRWTAWLIKSMSSRRS